ncbi:MAG: HEAT repeat domain-containing protein [Terriglobia bacterium]
MPKRCSRAGWLNRCAAICLAFGLSAGLWAVPSRAGQNSANTESQKSAYAWAPALLYAVLTAPNAAARNYLYDAAFAAGPPIVPDLTAALQDDRTAEFAAQSLAFIGGDTAIAALAKLVNDPRNLALSRFYYGALGESDTPKANAVLLNVIRNANNQPDRTVTEAAIIALTARSDLSLVAPLQQAESKLTDPVIQDDLENTISIIRNRGRYLASQRGKSAGVSITQVVREYFRSGIAPAAHAVSRPGSPVGSQAPGFHVRIDRVVDSPGETRALAHVVFEEASASANYRIVLQQQDGRWTVASVWLGNEAERPRARPGLAPLSRRHTHP